MNILFISFNFPPVKAVSSVRTWNICLGLLAAGHKVQVVTVDEQTLEDNKLEVIPDLREIGTSESFSKIKVGSVWPELYGGRSSSVNRGVTRWLIRLLVRIASKLSVWSGFDPMLLWSISVWLRIRAKVDVDLVLVSGGPFSSFLPAIFLAKKLKCPLVLDYRDVWNNAPHTKFRISWNRLERWCIRQASLVISVSPSCLSSILGASQRYGAVITNGVSASVYQYRKHHLQAPEPIIVYAGAFYPPKRAVDPFFAALALAREYHGGVKNIRFVYLGPSTDYVKKVAQDHGVETLLECRGVVSHDEALELQAQSLCTLVVTTVEDLADGSDRGILTGKLFEAIELARNVLVISPTNSDVRELTKDIRHVQHFTGGQCEAMARWLGEISTSQLILSEYRPEYFSWSILGEKFSQLLKSQEEICD